MHVLLSKQVVLTSNHVNILHKTICLLFCFKYVHAHANSANSMVRIKSDR